MLVLARSTGQSIVLDGRITVTVLTTRTGLVRLGIEAPEGVGVRRGELDELPPARRPRHRPPAPAERADLSSASAGSLPASARSLPPAG